MKVIFLDIDGVLVTERSFWQAQLSHSGRVMFDRRGLKALRGLVERTGGKIVIISSWRPRQGERPSRPFLDLQTTLAHNLTPVWGWTPVLEADRRSDRGDEIVAWLAECSDLEGYVVLDDNDRFGHQPQVRRHWIEVNGRVGLTEELCRRADEILYSYSGDGD